MSRLENAIIDVFDDVNLEGTMKKIACNLSAQARSTQLPTIDDKELLEDDQFALTLITKEAHKLNKFPLDSYMNTALSNEYFDLNHHKLPEEAQKIAATQIKMACQRYSITPVESVKTASYKFPVHTNIYVQRTGDKANGTLLQKEAHQSDSSYFYALNGKYPMGDATQVHQAEGYFDKYASHFKPAERHEFANNVICRATELGVDVESRTIHKYAGMNYNGSVSDYLSTRRQLLSERPNFTTALDKLASYQSKTDPSTFAKVLHEFDKRAGLERYYDKGLQDPYVSTFGGLQKTASYLYEKDGLYMTESDLEKVAQSKYATLKNHFGSTLADGLKKEGSSAFLALPDDAQEIIARISSGEIQ